MRALLAVLPLALLAASLAGCTEPAVLPPPPQAAVAGPASAVNVTVGTSLLLTQARTLDGQFQSGFDDCRLLGMKGALVVAANLTASWVPGNPSVERLAFYLVEARSGGLSAHVELVPGAAAALELSKPLRGPLAVRAEVLPQPAAAAFEQEIQVELMLQAIGGEGPSVTPCRS